MAPMLRHVKLPSVLSVDEVSRLLETAHRAADDKSVSLFKRASLARRSVLLETLYASGMRISEAVRLPARATRTTTHHLLIRGKGDKERLVPLNEKCLEAILPDGEGSPRNTERARGRGSCMPFATARGT
jgi:integrase/recombinase XerD